MTLQMLYNRRMVLGRIKESRRFKRLKKLYDKYERILIPGMLLGGVLVDFITFKSISIRSAFILLAVHVVISGAAIIFINLIDARKWDDKYLWLQYVRLAAPLVQQFSFGALLSASLIFYWFSGSLSVSWPILLLIAALMASNELLRKYYLRPVVQVSVYFFVLFSLATLVLPFAVNAIGVGVFVIAGLLSLAFIVGYVGLVIKFLPELKPQIQHISVAVLCVYAGMNALYFLNIIPPIPLSIRDAEVVHDVRLENGDYVLTAEKVNIFERILPGQTMHLQEGDDLYLFTSIFAPPKLDTTIVHQWQYFDKDEGRWTDGELLSFSISGGRDSGFRGYSRKMVLQEGLWRIEVETTRGQVLGRVKFRIKYVKRQTKVEEIVK